MLLFPEPFPPAPVISPLPSPAFLSFLCLLVAEILTSPSLTLPVRKLSLTAVRGEIYATILFLPSLFPSIYPLPPDTLHLLFLFSPPSPPSCCTIGRLILILHIGIISILLTVKALSAAGRVQNLLSSGCSSLVRFQAGGMRAM